jgi:hypothetical protein
MPSYSLGLDFWVVDTGARAFVGVRHTLATDASVGGWQLARTGSGGRQCVVYHMCVVATMSLEGVRLPMVTMSMLLGRRRASMHRVLRPRRGGDVTLAPRMAYGLLAVNGALTSPGILTCS